MNKIFLSVILSVLCFANAEFIDDMYCRIAAKNSVLCSSESKPGQLYVYHLRKDGSWVRKFWLFGDEYFESVYVRTYKRYDYSEYCVWSEVVKSDSTVTDSSLMAIKKICPVVGDSILSEIKSGNKIDLPGFDLIFSADYDEPFSMVCGFHMFVETTKYNKKGIVTSKKKYELIPGDYCKKFLLNDQIYWKP